MRKALIKDGVVENVILVDPDNIPDWCADWPDAEGAGPGWKHVKKGKGKNFERIDPPVPDVAVDNGNPGGGPKP